MSLSLALGILVGELNGYRLLTTAHAQESGCGGTVTGSTVTINDGVANGGITVRNVLINGENVELAVIPGSIQIVRSEAKDAAGALVGGGAALAGALVGGGAPAPPSAGGALVGGGAPTPPGYSHDGEGEAPCSDDVVVGLSGALVGGGAPVVNNDEDNISVSGAVVRATGTFVGGTLTGENIVISNGIITGQNLLLNGATIEGGSIEGTITSVQISPVN